MRIAVFSMDNLYTIVLIGPNIRRKHKLIHKFVL